jgi:secondary thiamine-phosphate synthase enzyme
MIALAGAATMPSAGAVRGKRRAGKRNNGEDNADAHLKRQLMSHQVVLAITDGKLDLGPWEQVFYAEFDGRRPKRVVLKAIGD